MGGGPFERCCHTHRLIATAKIRIIMSISFEKLSTFALNDDILFVMPEDGGEILSAINLSLPKATKQVCRVSWKALKSRLDENWFNTDAEEVKSVFGAAVAMGHIDLVTHTIDLFKRCAGENNDFQRYLFDDLRQIKAAFKAAFSLCQHPTHLERVFLISKIIGFFPVALDCALIQTQHLFHFRKVQQAAFLADGILSAVDKINPDGSTFFERVSVESVSNRNTKEWEQFLASLDEGSRCNPVVPVKRLVDSLLQANLLPHEIEPCARLAVWIVEESLSFEKRIRFYQDKHLVTNNPNGIEDWKNWPLFYSLGFGTKQPNKDQDFKLYFFSVHNNGHQRALCETTRKKAQHHKSELLTHILIKTSNRMVNSPFACDDELQKTFRSFDSLWLKA